MTLSWESDEIATRNLRECTAARRAALRSSLPSRRGLSLCPPVGACCSAAFSRVDVTRSLAGDHRSRVLDERSIAPVGAPN